MEAKKMRAEVSLVDDCGDGSILVHLWTQDDPKLMPREGDTVEVTVVQEAGS